MRRGDPSAVFRFPSYQSGVLLIDELREAWRTESREHRVVLAGIGVIAIALRLAYLNQPMRYDESVTYVYFAALPWEQALSTYTYPNNHLFHTVLVKAAVGLLGNQPWVIRLPAFLAGLLIVPASYAVARALHGGRAAILASAIIAASGILTLYSTNARGYTLVVLAFLLLMLIAVRIKKGGHQGEWVAFGVIGALGMWTIPVMLFPLGAVALWVAIWALLTGATAEIRRLGTALLIAFALAAFAYSPVISNEGLAAIVRNRFVAPQGWITFFDQLPTTLREGLRSWGLGFPPIVSVALLGCAFAALAQHARVSLLPVNFCVAAFAWSAWLLVVTHRAPFSRIWLWFLPIAASLAGVGLVILLLRWPRTSAVAERKLPAIAAALAVLLTLAVVQSRAVTRSRDTGTFADAELAARTLRGMVTRGDRILASIPTNGPLAYYLDMWGVDLSTLTRTDDRAARIFVVVDLSEGQTLASVVGNSSARDPRQFVADSAPVRLPTSAIITFRRRHAASQ